MKKPESVVAAVLSSVAPAFSASHCIARQVSGELGSPGATIDLAAPEQNLAVAVQDSGHRKK